MSRRDPHPGPDPDETIVRPSSVRRPTPGGRRPQPARGDPTETPLTEGSGKEATIPSRTGLLSNCALSLLLLIPKLRTTAFHDAVGDLKDRLVTEIRSFQNRALQQGFTEKQVKIASYFLCTLIDETVFYTPWGGDSDWRHNSLLVTFHKEAWGGENFFQYLEPMLQRPAQNLDLLEVAYFCLSLGLEGKYRIEKDGLHRLDELRTEIYLAIQRYRGESDPGLSVHWEGMRGLHNPLSRRLPLWVAVVAVVLVLLFVYWGFNLTISKASDAVYDQWMTIAGNAPKAGPEPRVVCPARSDELPDLPPDQPLSPCQAEKLRGLLSSEIAQREVEVLEGPVLRMASAFPSGSDQVRSEYVALLHKLGQDLKADNCQVEVIGHTDNQPIRTIRFGSNTNLSVARAKKVAEILSAAVGSGERIQYAGRGEKEPIAPNNTPENRAINRRVDIHIR